MHGWVHRQCEDRAEHGLCLQVIMATNRADTLDPALLRPGRLDRKIEFPMPDRRQKRLVFQVRPWCHPCTQLGLRGSTNHDAVR